MGLENTYEEICAPADVVDEDWSDHDDEEV